MQHEYSHEHDTLPNNHEQNLTIMDKQHNITAHENTAMNTAKQSWEKKY